MIWNLVLKTNPKFVTFHLFLKNKKNIQKYEEKDLKNFYDYKKSIILFQIKNSTLLCKIDIFDVFNMINFFRIFVITRSRVILIESNF